MTEDDADAETDADAGDGAADPAEATLESALARAESDPASLTAADAVTVLAEGSVSDILNFRDAFVERAEGDPDLVREVTGGLGPVFDADDRERRNTAAQFVASLAREHRAAAAPAAADLIGLLDDEYTIARKSAAEALQWIGGEEPRHLFPAVEHLPVLLDSELPQTRQTAVVLAWVIAGEDATALTPVVDSLLGVLEEQIPEGEPVDVSPYNANEKADAIRAHQQEMQVDVRQARERAAVVLAAVADAEPSTMGARVDEVMDALDGEVDPLVEGSLVEVLGLVAQHDPDAVADAGAASAAGNLLDHDDRGLAAKAAWTLAMLAEDRPETVRDAVLPRVESVRDLLDEEESWSRGTAASLLGYLAGADPEAVEPARERLLELLDDEAPYVRGSAAMTVGDLGGEEVRPRLEALAEEDPDEEVRAAAATALEAL